METDREKLWRSVDEAIDRAAKANRLRMLPDLERKALDALAEKYSIKRTRGPWYWPFRESDTKLRARVLERITQ